MPVIIQADLPYRRDFGMAAELPQLLKNLFVQISRVIRMDPRGPVNIGIFLYEFPGGVQAFHIRADIDHGADALFRQGGEQLLPVLIKGLIVIVGVCLKNHLLRPPSADLRPGRHLLLRGNQGQIALRILRAEDHALGENPRQLGRL